MGREWTPSQRRTQAARLRVHIKTRTRRALAAALLASSARSHRIHIATAAAAALMLMTRHLTSALTGRTMLRKTRRISWWMSWTCTAAPRRSCIRARRPTSPGAIPQSISTDPQQSQPHRRCHRLGEEPSPHCPQLVRPHPQHRRRRLANLAEGTPQPMSAVTETRTSRQASGA